MPYGQPTANLGDGWTPSKVFDLAGNALDGNGDGGQVTSVPAPHLTFVIHHLAETSRNQAHGQSLPRCKQQRVGERVGQRRVGRALCVTHGLCVTLRETTMMSNPKSLRLRKSDECSSVCRRPRPVHWLCSSRHSRDGYRSRAGPSCRGHHQTAGRHCESRGATFQSET